MDIGINDKTREKIAEGLARLLQAATRSTSKRMAFTGT